MTLFTKNPLERLMMQRPYPGKEETPRTPAPEGKRRSVRTPTPAAFSHRCTMYP